MDSPDNRLSPEEVDAQLRAFTGADWAKAKSLARLAAVGLIGWSGDDLLSEALTRLLDGRRVWQRGVHALVTLKTIMRSISDGEFKKLKEGPIDSQVIVDGDEGREDEYAAQPAVVSISDTNILQSVIGRSQLKCVENLVEDDEDCGLLIQLWVEGLRGKEAAEEMGWDMKKYDAVRQRLFRRLQPLQDERKTS